MKLQYMIKLDEQEYKTCLEQELAFYGFTSNPLTNDMISVLWHDNISLDAAYRIACDVNSGFTFTESLDANI